MANVTPLAVVMDYNDGAVLVPGDVEHNEFADLICAAEKLPHTRKILPASSFNGLDPMPQRRLRIGIFSPELLQRPAGYQMHSLSFSQNAKDEVNRIFSQSSRFGDSNGGADHAQAAHRVKERQRMEYCGTETIGAKP